MNKKWIAVIGVGIVVLAVVALMTGEQKLDKVINVQLGQPIVIGPAEKEIQLLDRLQFDKANIGIDIDAFKIDENQRSILLWQYCVPEISRDLRETKDFKEGRVKDFEHFLYNPYIKYNKTKPYVSIGYGKCWFNSTENYTHYRYGFGYLQEGQTKCYDDLRITWESTTVKTINNESVITIKLRITQV